MSAEINLVPDYLKKREKRSRSFSIFFRVFLFLVVISVFAFAGSYYLKHKISGELKVLEENVTSTENSIALLNETKIKLSLSISRLQIIKDLLAKRDNYSIFFSETEKLTPQGVVISEVTINDSKKASIKGEASSYSLLSDYLSTLSGSALLNNSIIKDSSLSEVSLKKESGLISFSLDIFLKDGALFNNN
jgi:Tfp pilus assembly protein PilN